MRRLRGRYGVSTVRYRRAIWRMENMRKSHGAHLEIEEEMKPRTKAEGDLILGVHTKGRKQP